MTPIGHGLVGACCGILACPSGLTMRQKIRFVIPFAFIAGVPDLPFQGWGHNTYYLSHSVFVTLALIGVSLAVWKIFCILFKRKIHWNIAIGLSCAWLSHLLLDSFYNHGRGIRAFWPLSKDAALKLPIPWLNTINISMPLLGQHNVKTYLIEAMTFVPVLILCLLFCHFKSRKLHRVPDAALS